MSGSDDENDDSSASESGFNEEYESLSDHEKIANLNPFANRPLVETVSSPSSNSRSSPSTSLLLSSSASAAAAEKRRTSSFSPFDPMTSGQSSATSSPAFANRSSSPRGPLNSLLDESFEHPSTRTTVTTGITNESVRMAQHTTTSGMAGFLEMEEEPIRVRHAEAERVLQEQEDLIDFTPAEEPIQTSSGLLLTHRRTSFEKRAERSSSSHHPVSDRSSRYYGNSSSYYPASYRPNPTRFEVESIPRGVGRAAGDGGNPFGFGHAPAAILQARRLLSFAKLWVIFFCVVLVMGTGVIFHAFRHEDSRVLETTRQQQKANRNRNNQQVVGEEQEMPQQILLLPLNNASELARQQREFEEAQRQHERPGSRRLLTNLSDLRNEFEEWIIKHKKIYPSSHEKERRFGIWQDNHFRTIEKNKKHGNCPLMNKPVFGSNHLKDLTTEEFQSQFLTGYNGPNADGHEIKTGRKRNLKAARSPPVMHPDLEVTRHPSVHHRMLQQWQLSGYSASFSSCVWYDISCWMRIFFQEYLYVGTGTMEPKYDSNTYPTAFDWRDMGAITSVRRQGDCGACWAITAVETIEAAYFIGTGSLLDLSETEVISCTDSCNMCYGGWPQDAYDYVMDHGGILLANDWSYDGDTLLSLTQEMEKDDATLDGDLFASFISENCPAAQGSGDNKDGGGGEALYGNIKGYGFATDRCVCYSDGSGCDCDNQNEGLAVRNLASYGPATVCLDASTWQDYAGGIITAYSGCSAKFLAMNHCVQVVGYAYSDGRGGDDDSENSRDSNSNSHDSGSGSQDSSNRMGYWIVRNQWSSNWGMSGYAYVSMGANTCGILNDMTQAYM